MNKLTGLVSGLGVVGVLAATAVFAANSSVDAIADGKVMKPVHGISFDIGHKHAVGYFEAEEGGCSVTVVLADVNGGETGDSPGTRVKSAVLPGKSLQVDAGAGKSLEFSCAKSGDRMTARLFDRTPYNKS